MTTPIIAFAATKGGVGKTTLAVNTAVEFSRKGKKVLFVDSDPGKDGLSFFRYREQTAGKSDVTSLYGYSEDIHKQLLTIAQRHDYDLIVVDSGGMDSAPQRLVLSVADIHYHPTMIGRADLGRIVALGTSPGFRKVRNGRPTYLVLSNVWNTFTNFHQSFVEHATKQFPACQTTFPRRITYVEAWSAGQTPGEFVEFPGSNAAARELADFVAEVEAHLETLAE